MKEILERVGLVDLFAYLCPGIIVLLSFTLWLNLELKSEPWKQQVVVLAAVFLLSYAIGIVLSSSVVERWLARIRARGTLTHPTGFTGWIGWLGPFPAPRVTPEMVEVNLRINEEVGRLIGVPGMARLVTPWEFLVLYRTLMAQRLGKAAKSLLAEAEAFHRRFRFCSGVSLACVVVVVQAAVRLILGIIQGVARTYGYCMPAGPPKLSPEVIRVLPCPLYDVSLWFLLALMLFGTIAAVGLRHVGNHMWELERYLTFSLSQPPAQQGGQPFGR